MSLIQQAIIDIADYVEHPRNYNEHPDPQIADIMASLTEFGQVKGVVVWRDYIIAGNGVVKAARRKGWTQLKAEKLPDEWPEYKALAYLAADNELARGAAPNLQALAQLAEDIRQEDAALAVLAAGGEEALAELDAMAALLESGEDARPDLKAGLGDRQRIVKAVMYVEDVATFERAMRATGNDNRNEAIMDICRFYLESHATESQPER